LVSFPWHVASLTYYHGLIGIAVDLGWLGGGDDFGFGFDSIRMGDDSHSVRQRR
jgi:hypothetical protein